MADMKLASAGDDIKLWDCGGYSLIKQFNPHTNQNVSSLCWSPDNTILASASVGGDKISLTYSTSASYSSDLAVGAVPCAEFPTVPLGKDSRTCLAFNSTARYIMGGGPDGIIHLWDRKTHKLKKSYRDHKGPLTTLQFNWNDTDIASASESGEIILYNVVSGQASIPLTAPRVQAVRQLQYSHFTKSLLGAVSEDGAVNLWDTNRRTLIHSFSDLHKAPATGLAFSPRNEMLLMSVGLDKRIICYDVQGKSVVKTMMAESPLTSIDLLYDGATLAVGSTRGKVFIYDLRQGDSPIRTMTAHKSSVQALAFQYSSKLKADVGGAPTRTGSLSRKANVNNNATTTANPVGRKPVNGVMGADLDVNSAATQGGLDSTNNNRLEGVNSNKDAANYNAVFSPIRDTAYTSGVGRSGDSSLAESRSDVAASGALSGAENSIEKYGDGVFSPLGGDAGGITARSQKTDCLREASPITTRVSSLVLAGDQGRLNSHSPVSTTHVGAESITQQKYSSSRMASNLGLSTSPKGSVLRDRPDFYHSQSEPTIAYRGDETGSRTRTSPLSRAFQPTPDDAGATSLAGDQRRLSMSPVTTPPEATAAPGAEVIQQRHGSRSRSGSSQGHPVAAFQLDMVRSIVNEALDEFRDQVRRDVLNLHMDVLKQFQIQQAEIQQLLQKYSVNEELMGEIERLREENERLKKKF